MSDIHTSRCTHRLCALASDLRVWNTLFIPDVRVFGMMNNENYMSGVGTQQFQAFPFCYILLSNVGRSGILNLIWLWILIRRTKPSGCRTVAGAELTPQRHGVISHKTWVFSNTAVGTSNHGLLLVYVWSFVSGFMSFLCAYLTTLLLNHAAWLRTLGWLMNCKGFGR